MKTKYEEFNNGHRIFSIETENKINGTAIHISFGEYAYVYYIKFTSESKKDMFKLCEMFTRDLKKELSGLETKGEIKNLNLSDKLLIALVVMLTVEL